MIHKNCTDAVFAPRLIVLAMSASASFGHFVANAYSRSVPILLQKSKIAR
jgi:hypothetical protein